MTLFAWLQQWRRYLKPRSEDPLNARLDLAIFFSLGKHFTAIFSAWLQVCGRNALCYPGPTRGGPSRCAAPGPVRVWGPVKIKVQNCNRNNAYIFYCCFEAERDFYVYCHEQISQECCGEGIYAGNPSSNI